MVATTAKGEVISVAEADQFQPARSQFECGYFSCAIARSMARPGEQPALSVQQIIQKAEAWYAQYNGTDAATNTAGMTEEQEYELLKQIGLHYQAIDPNIHQIKQWVSMGYPVMIAVQETSVHDLALDGANPYPWHPAGTHIILVTGIGAGGHVLCRDSANVSSLSDPQSLRPGPRLYDAGKLQLVSATVIVPPWRPRPASADAIPVADMQIPDGWQDDMPSQTLTAPNGVPVTGAFRLFVLCSAWPSNDVPMGPEHSANPVEIGWQQRDGNNAGTRQIFLYSELCETPTRNVYRASVGREFWTLLQQQRQSQPAPVTTDNSAAKQNILAAAKLIGDTATEVLSQAQAIV